MPFGQWPALHITLPGHAYLLNRKVGRGAIRAAGCAGASDGTMRLWTRQVRFASVRQRTETSRQDGVPARMVMDEFDVGRKQTTVENHRPYLVAPGESLVGIGDAGELFDRFHQFTQESGLDTSMVLSTLTSAIPYPSYLDRSPGQVRWPGVNPSLLWHPMFWLPVPVSQRYPIEGGWLESDEAWTLRVSLELTYARLYDVDTGMFTDVLAPLGIDVTTRHGLNRVTSWNNGGPDDELDALTLAPIFDRTDRTESFEELLQVSVQTCDEVMDMSKRNIAAQMVADLGEIDVDGPDVKQYLLLSLDTMETVMGDDLDQIDTGVGDFASNDRSRLVGLMSASNDSYAHGWHGSLLSQTRDLWSALLGYYDEKTDEFVAKLNQGE